MHIIFKILVCYYVGIKEELFNNMYVSICRMFDVLVPYLYSVCFYFIQVPGSYLYKYKQKVFGEDNKLLLELNSFNRYNTKDVIFSTTASFIPIYMIFVRTCRERGVEYVYKIFHSKI